ncbi:glutathione S-transferase theta-1-like [Trichoplusia ni]|uniref:Glutathione S-transferase theta-1-like n=1 Tax=Trichoplusia ni TaxID=7111 RepID=A0A7E5WE58_TRINI|nr:glutathione S-transferase theta-1-like [Trichoplusia ni]
MALKLYYDLMSQPSRSLYILLKYANCNFESKLLALRKGEHFGEEFTAINRLQKVPVIDHNGFVLTESVAIIKYLSRENLIPDSIYPKASKQAARVEEFLEWHHAGLRLHCAMFFRVKFLIPSIVGQPEEPKNIDGYLRRMEAALKEFDTKWLGRGNNFITGNTVTVADLFAACEVEQPKMAGYNPCEKFENINVWLKKVRDHFNPYYDEAHEVLNKIGKNKFKMASKV